MFLLVALSLICPLVLDLLACDWLLWEGGAILCYR